jgi:hypothetical protein
MNTSGPGWAHLGRPVQIPIEAICEVGQGRPSGRLGYLLVGVILREVGSGGRGFRVGTEGIRYFFWSFAVQNF